MPGAACVEWLPCAAAPPAPALGPRGSGGRAGLRAGGGGGTRRPRAACRPCARVRGRRGARGGRPGRAGPAAVKLGPAGEARLARDGASRRGVRMPKRSSSPAPAAAPRARSASRGEPAGARAGGRGGRRAAAARAAGGGGFAELLPGLGTGKHRRQVPAREDASSAPGWGAERAPPLCSFGLGKLLPGPDARGVKPANGAWTALRISGGRRVGEGRPDRRTRGAAACAAGRGVY